MCTYIIIYNDYPLRIADSYLGQGVAFSVLHDLAACCAALVGLIR